MISDDTLAFFIASGIAIVAGLSLMYGFEPKRSKPGQVTLSQPSKSDDWEEHGGSWG